MSVRYYEGSCNRFSHNRGLRCTIRTLLKEACEFGQEILLTDEMRYFARQCVSMGCNDSFLMREMDQQSILVNLDTLEAGRCG